MQTPMSEDNMTSYRRLRFTRAAYRRTLWTAILGASVVLFGTPESRADFSGNGDIVGTVDNAGNTSSPGDLIIGDEGTAGVFGDGALPLAGGDLNPLRSDLSIIGNEVTSIGAVTLEDFLFLPGETDPSGGNWLIDEELSVGNNGQGFLDLLNSARVEVVEDTWVGGSDGSGALDTPTGEGHGLVTINGTGTRLVTGTSNGLTQGFYVGYDGFGDVEVSGRGSIETRGFAVIGEENAANGKVTLTDRGTRWTIDADLTIGNGVLNNSSAVGNLIINSDAQVLVKDDLFVNPLGNVVLGGGNLELENPTGDTITNRGTISGHGFVEGALTIEGRGVLSNRALGEDQRQHLQIASPVTNNSIIESFGGEMTFASTITNNVELVARDAIMTFNGGVDNLGSISVGGNSTLHGDIDMMGGSLVVLSDSESLLVGDLVFTASSVLGLTVGPDAGTLDVTGMADLSNAVISLDYSAGIASQPLDSYQIFQANGGITGAFPTTATADGRVWDIDLVGNTLIATATALSALANGPDFNGDGIVDATDLAIWSANFGLMGPAGSIDEFGDADMDGDVDGADYLAILRNLGGPPPVSALTAVVPEPTTFALVLATLACFVGRRSRG